MHYYLARALCKCIYEYNLFLKRWCPCSGTISMEPHRVDVSWKTTKVQKREEEGRKKEERKKEKLSISSPVTVLSNHSSSSSAWPKPIQFQFRFSQTNPVPFQVFGNQSSFSWQIEDLIQIQLRKREPVQHQSTPWSKKNRSILLKMQPVHKLGPKAKAKETKESQVCGS